MDEAALAGYLSRIGASGPQVLDAASLADLHRAHLLTVPFENLSIHLGEEISLAEDDLLAKVVARRRGGFCYELNGAFALLLEALGAQVTRVAARVYGGERIGPPFDHLALIVRTSDGTGPWLADVGFGGHSTYPLLLNSRDVQQDPGGNFVIADADDGDLNVLKDGAPQYRMEMRPRDLDDFTATCWYQRTSPLSHFTQGVICSLLTESGRVTISDRTLIRTTADQRNEQDLSTDADVLAAYGEYFGIWLDRPPRVPVPVRLEEAGGG